MTHKKETEIPIEYRSIKPAFKLVFLTVLGLVLLFFITSVVLSYKPDLTEGGKSVMDTSLTLAKVGSGFVFGLLGGKVIP